ncbi:MAG: hydrogenase formation protein HypD [Desulfosalsimonas sp.]
MLHVSEYRDSRLCRSIAERIAGISKSRMRIMEVCGTHTVSIFKNGIRSFLPENVSLVSGPGCPVCVTAQGEIDAAVDLAGRKNTIVATFGDMMRVPGSNSSLQQEKAAGKDIRMVYSASDAVDIAKGNPGSNVVFLGVGFETTAPTVAAAVLSASAEGVENFSVLCMHKLVPPALGALMRSDGVDIDGLLLPGHVSVIIGTMAYEDFFSEHRIPCAVAGFEPADILQGVMRLAEMTETNSPELENCYGRAVTRQGNPAARKVMDTVFEPCDAQWRGLGLIEKSGLRFRRKYSNMDGAKRFTLPASVGSMPDGCSCGDILTGKKTPPECRLYGRSCTPSDPVGPCMVSSEGACAAYFKYSRRLRR